VKSSNASYRRDIDGLRAIAVLSVVIHHAFDGHIRGGFIGVDVFFVISGYLISGIILRQIQEDRFSFLDFYINRLRRIFPALFLVLAATLGYSFVVLLPSEREVLGKHIAAGASFVSNFVFWGESGYFEKSSILKPLLHLWSLGVEEQFYILWPAILLIAFKLRLNLKHTLFIIFTASFIANIILSIHDPSGDYFLPISRFWELMAGAAIAFGEGLRPDSADGRTRWMSRVPVRHIVSVLGLILIVACAYKFRGRFHFPGWWALLPTLGTVMVIAAGPYAVVNRMVLSSPPLVWIGLISYPLYLWHWPLLSFQRIIDKDPQAWVTLVLLGASLILAWATYIFVEKPIRHGLEKHKGATAAILLGLVIGMGGVGLTLWLNKGEWPGIASTSPINMQKINQAFGEKVFNTTPGMKLTRHGEMIVTEMGNSSQSVLFAGDSLLLHYAPRIQKLYDENRLDKKVFFVAGASCPPFPGVIKTGWFAHCNEMHEIVRKTATENQIGTVVLGASWAGYQGAGLMISRDGKEIPGHLPEAVEAEYANIEDFVREFQTAGRRVYLILPSPTHGKFDPQTAVSRTMTGYTIDAESQEGVSTETLRINREKIATRLRDISARTGAGIIDPFDDICGTGPRCSIFFADGDPKFADMMHLRPSFVMDHITVFDALVSTPPR